MKTSEYLPTIGLEIHAELKTSTKMFCSSQNASEGSLPNTHICPICMGHPGTLPFVNEKAVESVIKVGIALGSTIATYTEFDRKNYFYPDIPKGYQISQYAYPLVKGGSLCGVEITRVHLEEDTARSLHDQGEGSVIDYNRAGVPLMELVTEPVIHDQATAVAFAKELQILLRTLGVSDAHMERGQMRVEANISVGKEGVLGTKVEVKNLNSFRAVESAIAHEIARHIEVIEGGGAIVQETRGWDEKGQKTFSQRKKESSHDYRYFPDPDIPKLKLDVDARFNISRLSEMMPELPSNIRIKYENIGLTRNQTEVLIYNPELKDFFERVRADFPKPEVVKLSANYLTSDVLGMLTADTTLHLHSESAGSFGKLMVLLLNSAVTSRVAKDLLHEVIFENKDSEELVSSRGLGAMGEEGLDAIIGQVVAENGKVVADYRSGKVAALQFLVGQGMRLSKGSANPDALKALFEARLK